MSDDTNSSCASPQSQSDSPYSSPSQNVPQLVNFISGLSCAERPIFKNVDGPYLRIVEQPMHNFRFRYKSEMAGTHGCLLGKSTSNGINKTKTHPTVELMNYSGGAVIRCCLVQSNCKDDHPHKLLDDGEEDRDVSAQVPQNGSYRIGFGGIGIIHTAKKDVANLLFNKITASSPSSVNAKMVTFAGIGIINLLKQDISKMFYNKLLKTAPSPVNHKKLKSQCEAIAKKIDLNIVRLRFTAHDLNTDMEICEPVYSDPIHNLKSAATNDLKICRMSKTSGLVTGDEEVFIFVEKVGKKNLEILFYETDDAGKEVWSDMAYFLPSDVHHQYGIVFKTPRYTNNIKEVTSDVHVQIVLRRPSDHRTSEPIPFTYKPDPLAKHNYKKRRANSSISSLSSGNSLNSICDIPITVTDFNFSEIKQEENHSMFTIPTQPQIPVVPTQAGDNILAFALSNSMITDSNEKLDCPMLSAPNVPEPPVLNIDSFEMENLTKNIPNITIEERDQLINSNWSDYLELMSTEKISCNSMEFIRSVLVADSGRPRPIKNCNTKISEPIHNSNSSSSSNEYTAVYSTKDSAEVVKLINELTKMRKTNTADKSLANQKMKRLFDLRLNNGDRVLHMTLIKNINSFNHVLNEVHKLKLSSLLQLGNDEGQTILHLAISNKMSEQILSLISKGCDPMAKDHLGNNAFHYAVNYRFGLDSLLQAVKAYKVKYDLDATNNENQSALHLAEKYGLVKYAKILLQNGASLNVRDSEGRNVVHVAAYNDNVDVMKVLLEFIKPSEIDKVDHQGFTALQIICGGPQRTHTLEIFTLLMDAGADPMKQHKDNQPAWKLVSNKPELFEIMKNMYIPSQLNICSDDIKSEPEDYESADDGETAMSGLAEFPLFIDEVAGILDDSGSWQELALRMELESMIDWCANNPSPTRTLLSVIKECRTEVSSKSLALVLDEMGKKDASSVIRRYLPK